MESAKAKVIETFNLLNNTQEFYIKVTPRTASIFSYSPFAGPDICELRASANGTLTVMGVDGPECVTNLTPSQILVKLKEAIGD